MHGCCLNNIYNLYLSLILLHKHGTVNSQLHCPPQNIMCRIFITFKERWFCFFYIYNYIIYAWYQFIKHLIGWFMVLSWSSIISSSEKRTCEMVIQWYVSRKEGNVLFNDAHSTHFIYSYMASDIWLRNILIVRKETSCRHIGYSLWLTARVLLYAPSQTG